MPVLIVASSESGAGKSLVAAALAYRLGREGKAVMLGRLAGDDGAERDAAAFARLDGIQTAGRPLTADDLKTQAGQDVILEAPAGPVAGVAKKLGARVLGVATPVSPPLDVTGDALAGTIVTRAPAADASRIVARQGVLCVLPEDRVLAAPSVADIASSINARWLTKADGSDSIDRVMIGTIASDAASPYFAARDRKCVVTRYDKTDVQLAALLTDVEMLVLTGGGEPSPYLLDRVAGTRDDISVVVVEEDTVDAMRAIEGLYGASRFEGNGKMLRAVELLDEAGCPSPL